MGEAWAALTRELCGEEGDTALENATLRKEVAMLREEVARPRAAGSAVEEAAPPA